MKNIKNEWSNIHNLDRLADAAGIETDTGTRNNLIRISEYNIESRYPDIRRAFREKCTEEYTRTELVLIKDICLWLRSITK